MQVKLSKQLKKHFEAFDKAVKKGLTIPEIAEQFSIGKSTVSLWKTKRLEYLALTSKKKPVKIKDSDVTAEDIGHYLLCGMTEREICNKHRTLSIGGLKTLLQKAGGKARVLAQIKADLHAADQQENSAKPEPEPGPEPESEPVKLETKVEPVKAPETSPEELLLRRFIGLLAANTELVSIASQLKISMELTTEIFYKKINVTEQRRYCKELCDAASGELTRDELANYYPWLAPELIPEDYKEPVKLADEPAPEPETIVKHVGVQIEDLKDVVSELVKEQVCTRLDEDSKKLINNRISNAMNEVSYLRNKTLSTVTNITTMLEDLRRRLNGPVAKPRI